MIMPLGGFNKPIVRLTSSIGLPLIISHAVEFFPCFPLCPHYNTAKTALQEKYLKAEDCKTDLRREICPLAGSCTRVLNQYL
jgi:hypothetical protein